jgi:hypothetical protein
MRKSTKNKKIGYKIFFLIFCYKFFWRFFSKRLGKNSPIFTKKQKFPHLLDLYLVQQQLFFFFSFSFFCVVARMRKFIKNKKIGYKIFFLIFCYEVFWRFFSKRLEKNSPIFTKKQKFPRLLV